MVITVTTVYYYYYYYNGSNQPSCRLILLHCKLTQTSRLY